MVAEISEQTVISAIISAVVAIAILFVKNLLLNLTERIKTFKSTI